MLKQNQFTGSLGGGAGVGVREERARLFSPSAFGGTPLSRLVELAAVPN